MIYFSTRSKARNFATKGTNPKKVLDLGQDSPKRWAVKIV